MNSKLSFQTTFYTAWSLALLVFFGQPLVAAFIAPQAGYAGAYAQEESQKPKKTRRTPAMRESVYKKLSEAQVLGDEGKHARALEMLNEIKADPNLNEYELGMTWNLIAVVHSTQENYKQALVAFKEIKKLANVPEALEQQALLSIAQLHLALDQPQETIKAIREYHQIATPTTQTYVLYGQACYLTEDYKCSVAQVEKAMSLAKAQGQQPQEQWLLILRAGYYELNNTPKMIEVLELLVSLYPKGDYFAQLSAMYGEIKNESKQLAVIEASYDGGYFSKEREYLNLAALLMNAEVPYKAARVLVAGMDKKIVEDSVTNLKMLAQAWVMSQEAQKSIDVLRAAAKKSDDGELYVRLGQSHMNLDQWDDCIGALNSGLKKGGIKRQDSAHVALGICLFNVDKLDQAIEQFKEAAKDERSKKFADNWIQYLRNEKSRRASIQDSLI